MREPRHPLDTLYFWRDGWAAADRWWMIFRHPYKEQRQRRRRRLVQAMKRIERYGTGGRATGSK